MATISKEQWESFQHHPCWVEIVKTIKDRCSLIVMDILDNEKCNSEVELARLQSAYSECLYFINLPRLDEMGQGERDES